MDMQEINVKLIAINNALPESVNLSSAKDLMSLIQVNGISLKRRAYCIPEKWEAIYGSCDSDPDNSIVQYDDSPSHALFKVLYELAIVGKLVPSKG